MMIARSNIILLFASAWLVGCATGPVQKTSELLPAPAPSYSEKVEAVPVQQADKTVCPSDAKWETLEWNKVILLANACVRSKNWHKVEKIGNHLATHAYLTPWGAYFMSLSAESRKDYSRAVWMLELALKKDPNEGIFHYQMGRLHWLLKEDSLALKELKLASDLNPSLTDAHFVMGQIAAQSGESANAEDYFNKALASKPHYFPALLALASLRINAKEWAKAEDYLNQALAVNANSSKARMALAEVQEEHLKKFQEALGNYRQLKQLAADKKLDENVHMNLEEKIKNLEKSLSQVKGSQATVRQPSAAERVH